MSTIDGSASRDRSEELDVARVRRALLERIEIVASAKVAEGILGVALSLASLDEVPTRSDALGEFVRGALHARMSEVLGDDTATLLLAELSSVVRHLEGRGDEKQITEERRRARPFVRNLDALRAERSGSAPKPPRLPATPETKGGLLEPEAHALPDARPATAVRADEKETARPEARATVTPGDEIFVRATRLPSRTSELGVFVATSDPARCAAIEGALGIPARVQIVVDAMDLLDAMELVMEGTPVVVLDADAGTVRPATLASMLPDFGKRVSVVLLGYDEETRRVVTSLSSDAAKWTWLPGELSPRDVGVLLRTL